MNRGLLTSSLRKITEPGITGPSPHLPYATTARKLPRNLTRAPCAQVTARPRCESSHANLLSSNQYPQTGRTGKSPTVRLQNSGNVSRETKKKKPRQFKTPWSKSAAKKSAAQESPRPTKGRSAKAGASLSDRLKDQIVRKMRRTGIKSSFSRPSQ